MTKSQRIFFLLFFTCMTHAPAQKKRIMRRRKKRDTLSFRPADLLIWCVLTAVSAGAHCCNRQNINWKFISPFLTDSDLWKEKFFVACQKKKKKKWRDFLMFLNNQLGSILRPLVLKRNERGFIWRTQWAILPKTIMVHVFFLFSFHLHKLHSFDSVHKQINGCLLCRRPSLNRVTAAEHSS